MENIVSWRWFYEICVKFLSQVLGDEGKRQEYDTFGMSGGAKAGMGGFQNARGFSQGGKSLLVSLRSEPSHVSFVIVLMLDFMSWSKKIASPVVAQYL